MGVTVYHNKTYREWRGVVYCPTLISLTPTRRLMVMRDRMWGLALGVGGYSISQ